MLMKSKTKTERESQMLKRAELVLPQGTLGNLPYETIISHGKGSHIWDESGNEYVDYLLGSGPMIVGHAHPKVTEAVLSQIDNGTTFFATNEKAISLAEEIVDAVPCAEKVRFCSTGSEATLYAMRTARAFRGRDKILKFEGGFHGMNDYALMSMSPTKSLEYPQAEPDSAGIPASIAEEMLIAPFNNLEITTAIIETHHDELGGVIIEPFQRLIPPRKGFLEGLREITEHYEIPLIFDEVVTGFRFAYGGAQEYYGVEPDICTLGKAVAGGFPLTAVAGKDYLMNHFSSDSVEKENFMPQIGTLSGNPVACAAGLEVLSILKTPGIYESMFKTGMETMKALQSTFDDANIPAKVVGEPILFDVFFTDHDVYDYRTSILGNPSTLAKFNSILLENGIFKGTTKFYFSTEHSEDDLKKTINAFEIASDRLNN